MTESGRVLHLGAEAVNAIAVADWATLLVSAQNLQKRGGTSKEIPETVGEMVARMVAMGPASVTDATRLATLPESAPATLVSHILAAAGKLYLPEEAAEIMEEGESGEAAKNMEQANVSSVTGMDTLRENAVRKRIGVTSATSLAILRKIAPRKMSVTSATRKATWPKTARTRARRPATAAQVKATLPWTVPAARETWTE